MFEGFDEADLLALIEDGLEPERAAVLRQRLADDPRAAAMIERLRSDRDLLRTTPDPPVPADLLAELEPMIARPMLMPEPTDWRRRYRRRRPWGRYAVAAVVVIAMLAGVWASITAIGRLTAPRQELARGPAPDATPRTTITNATEPVADDDAAWPPGDAEIHHHAPMTALADAGSPDRLGVTAPQRPRPATASTQLVLVVDADDEAAVEAALRSALADLAGDAALVRNFSYQEAERLFREHRMADARRAPDDLAEAFADFAGIAGADGDRPGTPDRRRKRRAAERLARTLEQSDHPPSGRLLGPRTLAPGYDRQLEFSELGATFTLAVPAGALADVLACLQLEQGQATALRTAEGFENDSGAGPWLADYARARAAARLLDPGETVLLPVVVARE